jgi:cation diffusion facilitator CzcD-associated flavoprotein CzcO
MNNYETLGVAIIGAGPTGLTLARRFGETSASFRVFERHHDAGGIWEIDAPGSPMYESAHLISSKTLSGFPEFSITLRTIPTTDSCWSTFVPSPITVISVSTSASTH